MLSVQLRRTVRLRSFSRCFRSFSTGNETYPPKVRALPFVVPAEEAIRRCSVALSMRNGFSALFSAVLARFLPWLGTEHFRPVRIQAAYLPAWMVDAEVAAEGWYADADEDAKQTLLRAIMLQSYMPAFVYEPLSNISLKHPIFKDFSNVRWSEDLKTQHGSDILCLPFAVTPFKLIDLARSLSLKDATVSEKLRFDPTTVKEEMIAAYPLLIPVYLAEYEFPYMNLLNNVPKGTVVFEAHAKRGRIIVENVERRMADASLANIRQASGQEPPELMKTLAEILPEDDLFAFGPHSSQIDNFASVENIIVYSRPASTPSRVTQMLHLQQWIDSAATRVDALPGYRKRFFEGQGDDASPAVDWDDPRIREYTQEETAQNRRWLRRRELSRSLEAEGMNIVKEDDDVRIPELREHLEQMERLEAGKRPEWLNEWIRRSSPPSEANVADGRAAAGLELKEKVA